MKKLFTVWALVVLLLPMFANATTVNVARDGTVWIEKQLPTVTKTEVVFGEGVLEHGDTWKQAFLNQGTVVAVEAHIISKRDGLFHVVQTIVVDVGIVYDNQGVRVVRDVVGEVKISFNPYSIMWLASILAMTIGLVMVRRGRSGTITIFVALALALATTIASGISSTGITDTTAFVAIATSFALVITINTGIYTRVFEEKVFYFFVVAYYATMTVSMATFLLN